MKKFIFLISLGLLFMSSQAFAKDKNSYYAGVYGGAMQFDTSSQDQKDRNLPQLEGELGTREYEYGIGFRLGAFVGKRFNKNFRGELEYSYLKGNETSLVNHWINDPANRRRHLFNNDASQKGTQTIHVLLVNAIYDFEVMRKVSNFIPFVGVGIGAAWLKQTSDDFYDTYHAGDPTAGKKFTGAGQLMAGVNYDIGDFTTSVNYKYLRLLYPTFKSHITNEWAGEYVYYRDPGESHSFGVSVAYNF